MAKPEVKGKLGFFYDGGDGDRWIHNGDDWVEFVEPSEGPKGDKGDQGEPGPQGPKGDPGIQGPIGPQGPVGPKGATGEPGPKGDKGDTGAASTVPGPKGDQGIQGLKGDKGEKGDTGPVGPQGPQGEKGATGATGPQGPKGDVGATGARGPAGPAGPKGDQGVQGLRGPQGEKGETGDTGPKGDKGDPGIVAWATTDEIKDGTVTDKAISPKAYKDSFGQNGSFLLQNDESASVPASIGSNYSGIQFYGFRSKGGLFIGQRAIGKVSLGEDSTGGITIGNRAVGETNIGSYSTGGIKIGSTVGTQSNNKIIAGTKSATFEDIVNSTTISYIEFQTIPTRPTIRISVSKSGNIVTMSINTTGNSGDFYDVPSGIVIGKLSLGYRPKYIYYDAPLVSYSTGEFGILRIHPDGSVMVMRELKSSMVGSVAYVS